MGQQLSLNLGLPAQPADDMSPEMFREVIKIHSAIKLVAGALDQYTGALGQEEAVWSQVSPVATLGGEYRRIYVPCSENLPAGSFVNLYNNAGTLTARLATSGAGLKCRGFVTKTAASGDFCEIILRGLHVLVTGLTPGTIYYIAGIPGQMTSAVTAQKLGYALSDSLLWFDPELIA